ncbi:MAG: AMP-binding protein [Candidatus Hydrothermia bacterium]|nr:AMP-binding protein [Candidatus Hydrothermia bacterium]
MQFPTVRPGIGWFTIPEMLERSCTLYKDQMALMMREKEEWVTFTYEDMYNHIKRLAKYLRDEVGLKKGDKAAVIGENSPYWVVGYFAYQWLGVTVVPVDARLKIPEIKFILEDSEATTIIAQNAFLEDLLEIKKEVQTLKHIISMEPNNFALPCYEDIFKEVKTGMSSAKVSLDDYAVILYTSGTTGVSKGVVLSHKNIMSDVDSLYQTLHYGPGDIFFSVLPLHHIYEQTCGMIVPIAGGASIAYASSLKSKIMIEEMQYVRPTIMLVVPLLLEKIVEGILTNVEKSGILLKTVFTGLKGVSKGLDSFLKGRAAKVLFKSIRTQLGMDHLHYLVSGGAALPRWVSKALEEMGFPILQGYGLSETSPVIALNPLCCPRNESAGLPVPYAEIRVHEPNSEGIGEISVKGPMVMVGYYKNEEATRSVFTDDGWFLTGDMGYLDKDGYVYITGRKKSVIVTAGGKNVYPEEVETVLLRSPYIEEVLVIGAYDSKKKHEEVHAIVYPKLEAVYEYFRERGIENPTFEDIYKLIDREIEMQCDSLAEYKRVRRFTIREEEFPKNTSMKIKRYLFEQQRTENKK